MTSYGSLTDLHMIV